MANIYFRGVWKVHKVLLDTVKGPYSFLTPMVKQMQEKFNKYWAEYSLILSCAAILDPRYKLNYVQYCFTTIYGIHASDFVETILSNLRLLFDEYVKKSKSTSSSLAGSSNVSDKNPVDSSLGEHNVNNVDFGGDFDVFGVVGDAVFCAVLLLFGCCFGAVLKISFENEDDMEAIMNGRSWLFRKELIIFERLIEAIERSKIKLICSPFWLRVSSCPPECEKKDLTHAIGSTFGGILRSDIKEELYRIQILLDARKPLRRALKAKSNLVGRGSFKLGMADKKFAEQHLYTGDEDERIPPLASLIKDEVTRANEEMENMIQAKLHTKKLNEEEKTITAQQNVIIEKVI
ncbi:hypothetical protein GOBAR_AA17528 [Gossypium barbadense]|uniref:hAT-like transposase RNase-H fold domain-containing protein n=1 Tax=Gossypium barbadense TaxID=3634 RepID=A0A2P5XIG1_GOSBA|nr:hypothetical protein GOBAR_AA17528 [Gossypium barbadense]